MHIVRSPSATSKAVQLLLSVLGHLRERWLDAKTQAAAKPSRSSGSNQDTSADWQKVLLLPKAACRGWRWCSWQVAAGADMPLPEHAAEACPLHHLTLICTASERMQVSKCNANMPVLSAGLAQGAAFSRCCPSICPCQLSLIRVLVTWAVEAICLISGQL